MRRVFYPSGSVLTGDSIAQAVLEFAEALAKDGVGAMRVHPFSLYGDGAQNPGALSLQARLERMGRYMDDVIRPFVRHA